MGRHLGDDVGDLAFSRVRRRGANRHCHGPDGKRRRQHSRYTRLPPMPIAHAIF
jgi:hypothetical protein